MVKLKKKKKTASKKSNGQSIEQRRHEYEVAKREKNQERIAASIEKYNNTQDGRNQLLEKLVNLTLVRRATIQKMVDRELARQTEVVSKHDVLKKLGVGLKLPKLEPAKLPSPDPKYYTEPLRLTVKPAKSKAKKKRPKPVSQAPSSNGATE